MNEKMTKDAEQTLKTLFGDRDRAISMAAQPYDNMIDIFVRGYANGKGIDLNKMIFSFESFSFEERK